MSSLRVSSVDRVRPSVRAVLGDSPTVNDENRLAALHSAIGRDSEVGRLMFNIYNKGRINYTPDVPIKVKRVDPSKAHQEKKKLELENLKKPKYEAPKLKKSQPPQEEVKFPSPTRPGRKPVSLIRQEMELEKVEFPSRPSLIPRSEQISRLQDSMAGETRNDYGGLRGKALESATEYSRMRKLDAISLMKRTKKSEEEELRDCIIKEIVEREEFLEKMKRLGTLGRKEEESIIGEIAEKLRDLKTVEKLMEKQK
jgi:hypothetical protein